VSKLRDFVPLWQKKTFWSGLKVNATNAFYPIKTEKYRLH
jgi:hypothetical protein